jgi:hypothetical protein
MWRNSKSGRAGISKILDIFLVSERIMEEVDKLKVWVGNWDLYNHLPIFLQIDSKSQKPPTPSNLIICGLKRKNLEK